MRILQVKQYHSQIANVNYQRAKERWRNRSHPMGFPILSMFYFMLEDRKGYPIKIRRNGYVAFEGDKYCFGLNIDKAITVFNH